MPATQGWKYKLDLKSIWAKYDEDFGENDPLPDEIRQHTIAELEKLPQHIRDDAAGFSDSIQEKIDYLKNPNDIVDVCEYNQLLDDLYDLGDVHRIWMGF